MLKPKTKTGEILDYAYVTSAYGRESTNLQNLINSSEIYYICEDKKRTNKWLSALGLQLPSAITKYGSIDSTPNTPENVNNKFALPVDTEKNETKLRENEDIRYSLTNDIDNENGKGYNTYGGENLKTTPKYLLPSGSSEW